jgi:dynein heavy chain, axonemal
VNVAQLSEDITNLTGNILLASASIAYVGPFTADFRQEMINSWKQLCKDKEIPVSDDYQLSRILATEVEVREWQEKGLPSDSLSIDNGIFMFNSRRWPLIIDPQGQANKWIKNVGKDVNIQVTKLTEHNFIKILENAIRNGQSVLMENVEEELDPSLEPILNKQIVKSAAGWVLRLGDSDIPYGKEFKFYMTTKMPNPHYIPEICIKTTIINFTVTPLGLEDQLLAEVVRFERIELETRRVELILQISQDKKQLQDLEDKILRLIGEAQGRILED